MQRNQERWMTAAILKEWKREQSNLNVENVNNTLNPTKRTMYEQSTSGSCLSLHLTPMQVRAKVSQRTGKASRSCKCLRSSDKKELAGEAKVTQELREYINGRYNYQHRVVRPFNFVQSSSKDISYSKFENDPKNTKLHKASNPYHTFTKMDST